MSCNFARSLTGALIFAAALAACAPDTPADGRDWNGTDAFTYQVEDADGQSSTAAVTVTPVDDGPPVAVDDIAQTPFDTPVTTAVLANDTVVDAPVSVAVAEGPQHGAAAANADGTITYTPAAGWSGTDSYRYSVADVDGQSSVATVTVTVMSAPPPVVAGGTADGTAVGSTDVGVADDGAGTGAPPPDAAGASQPPPVVSGVAGGGCSAGSAGAASALLVGLLALVRRRR
jgi:uncharacterized protein (TIGR03382 family)